MDVEALERDALDAVARAGSSAELDEARVRFLGRRGELKQALRGVRDRESGMTLNAARELIERAFDDRAAALAGEEAAAAEGYDVTLPGEAHARGHLHLITQIRREVEDVFLGLGYEVVDGREVETTHYNFEGLNFPPWHPARSPRSTLFLEEEVVLRTETSPSQVRTMELREPPVYMISTGRVYRRDTVDATHTPTFHQVEGLAVDRGITLADLKGTLLHFMRAIFGPERAVRFRTHYFPFTEPSIEPDVSCFLCDGSGCAVCKHSGWIEMGGSGMVDPKLYEFVGADRYDPEEVSGFAFGLGLERIALLRHGLPDIRLLWQNDLRFLGQFLKVPVSWLREYVAFDVPLGELADRLAVSSCEVERIERRGVPDTDGNLGLFRVGRVVEAGKHPNADRLQLCRVDVGEGELRQIVCGAWNFGAGATVAVALPGAVLPGGAQLGEAKLRGELSRGMILSERELELGPDHTGIMVLDTPAEPGAPLADVLPLGEEVLEVEVTGNRPDLLSIYGIAREVAALYDLPLAPMPGSEPEPARAGDEPVEIRIDELEACPIYVGRLFRDVVVGPSPPWLRARLTAAGMRPISNVVDATNYTMIALGSPTHVFDHDTLAEGRIVVRYARAGEHIRTLDGTERALDSADLVIADAGRAVALAAIMGGEETEVTAGTTSVLLEAANFEPIGILRSSERLKLRTDGSNRWEKGVDPHLAAAAARLCTRLLVEHAGARWTGEAVVSAELPGPSVMIIRPERTSELIGLDVPEGEQLAILERLGFELKPTGTGFEGFGTLVVAPSWRARDVTREIDLVEEVARFRLEDVPFTLPRRTAMFGRLTAAQRLRRTVEDALAGAGFSEAYTWSLVPDDPHPDAIALPEPISAEQRTLRTRLLPSLVEPARHNAELGLGDVALFEVARVYGPAGGGLPDERWHAAGIVADEGERAFFRAKGALETVLATLRVESRFERGPDGSATLPFATVERLGDELAGFELDLDALLGRLPGVPLYEDVITFPAVKQDLAFVVDESVAAGDLADAARDAAGPELREIRVFDVYRGDQAGPGKKSLAFRVEFQSPDRTLTDEEAAALRERIVDALAQRFGATLRA